MILIFKYCQHSKTTKIIANKTKDSKKKITKIFYLYLFTNLHHKNVINIQHYSLKTLFHVSRYLIFILYYCINIVQKLFYLKELLFKNIAHHIIIIIIIITYYITEIIYFLVPTLGFHILCSQQWAFRYIMKLADY